MSLSNNKIKYVSILLTALLLLPSLLTCFYIFPLNYGWWPYYNYLEFNDLKMYQDFNNVYAPLFTRFIEPISIFSLKPAVSLAMGIIRVYILFFILVYFFGRFFESSIALIGAFLVVIFQIQSNVFMPDDYHIFERTIFVICIFIYSNIIINREKLRIVYIETILLGIFGGLLVYSKQNVGLVCGFCFMIGILREGFLYKPKRSLTLIYPISIAISILLLSRALGITLNQFIEISFQNDSKGTTLSILTNIFLNKNNFNYIIVGLFFASSIYLLSDLSYLEGLRLRLSYLIKRYEESVISKIFDKRILFIGIFIYIVNRIYKHPDAIILSIAIISSIIIFVLSIFKKNKYYSLIYPGLGLAYANSMTSDIIGEALILVAAPIICFVLNSTSFSKNKFRYYFVILFVTIYSLGVFYAKANTPYSWWGFSQKRITESYYEPPYKLLKGLHVDGATIEALNSIKNAIDKYSHEKRDVYLYPHMPFFYILHNKLPPTKNSLQWFDVIKNSEMMNEVSFINAQNNINLLILFDPPNNVYLGHQDMKKIKLPQIDFINSVISLQSAEKIKLVDYKIFKNSLKLSNSGWINFEIPITVTNSEVIGTKYRDLLGGAPLKQIRLISLRRNGVDYSPTGVDSFSDKVIARNDVLTIEGDPGSVEDLIVKLGYVDKVSEDWFALKVYRKVTSQAFH